MTIVTDKTALSLQRGDKCSFCGARLYHPYLEWHATPADDDEPEFNTICICKQCFCKYAKGLRADLIQIQAIAELASLYPGFTLVRDTQQGRAQRLARLQEAEQRDHGVSYTKFLW
jgi:hypothetical protein